MLKKAGFTLVELLICLGGMAIILAFSIPLNRAFQQKNHFQVVVDEIKNAVQYAKTQMLLHNHALVLAPIEPNNWSYGMRLFEDNEHHQYSSNAKLIHEWHWKPTGIQITWNGFQANHYLLFATDIRHSASNGYFLINNKEQQQKLIINRLGRIREAN